MSRKTEAANMFEDEEDFDAAYSGATSSADTDDESGEDEEEIVVAAIADDEADSEADAWAAAEQDEENEDEEPSTFDDDEEEETSDDVLLSVKENAGIAEDDVLNENDDDEAEVSAAAEIINRRNNSMAKKSEGKKTKAEMIRDEITRRQKAKESLRACDIIASLADEGVEVNASQVSVTLRSLGVPSSGTRGRPAGQKKEKAAATSGTRGRPAKAASEEMSRKASRAVTEKPAQPKQPAAANGDSFTEADLEATAAFVGAVGNAGRGMTLLRIFSRLND